MEANRVMLDIRITSLCGATLHTLSNVHVMLCNLNHTITEKSNSNILSGRLVHRLAVKALL